MYFCVGQTTFCWCTCHKTKSNNQNCTTPTKNAKVPTKTWNKINDIVTQIAQLLAYYEQELVHYISGNNMELTAFSLLHVWSLVDCPHKDSPVQHQFDSLLNWFDDDGPILRSTNLTKMASSSTAIMMFRSHQSNHDRRFIISTAWL